MKRYRLLVTAVLLAAAILICYANEKLYTTMQEQNKKATVETKQSDILPESSEVLLESAVRATDLIKETVEPEKNFSLEFLLRKDGGDFFRIELPETWCLKDSEKEQLGSFSDQVVFNLMESKSVKNVYKAGDEAQVVGVIVRWVPNEEVLSVYDAENDGRWDYAYKGDLFFTEDPDQMLEDPSGEEFPIGSTDPDDGSLIPLDKAPKHLNFTSIQRLISHSS